MLLTLFTHDYIISISLSVITEGSMHFSLMKPHRHLLMDKEEDHESWTSWEGAGEGFLQSWKYTPCLVPEAQKTIAKHKDITNEER